jgi:hypothetical protein
MSSISPKPWYLDPITQAFNGGKEKGVDLGVPFHTPVTPTFPGTVSGISYGPYGAEVNVTGNLNGQPVTAAYVHLDTVNVATGQQVGQASTLGLSGGQLSGGQHPASPAYSSGPHIEFSLWPGGSTPYVGTPYNPMSFINAVQGSGGGLVNTLVNTLASGAGSVVPPPPQGGTAQGNNAVSDAYAQALASLSNLLPNLATQASNGVNVPANVSLSIPNLGSSISAGVASGVGAGITQGIQQGLIGGFMQWVGVTSASDLFWRVGLIVSAFVIGYVVLEATVLHDVSGVAVQVATNRAARALAA